MDVLLAQIRAAVRANLYYVALYAALALPDVCGALSSSDGEASGTKYVKWFDQYMGPKYTPSGTERVQGPSPGDEFRDQLEERWSTLARQRHAQSEENLRQYMRERLNATDSEVEQIPARMAEDFELFVFEYLSESNTAAPDWHAQVDGALMRFIQDYSRRTDPELEQWRTRIAEQRRMRDEKTLNEHPELEAIINRSRTRGQRGPTSTQPLPGPSLTGEDCYRFRCSLLHQGSTQHPKSRYRRIIFIEPGLGDFVLHMNVINDCLNLDLPTFCDDMVEAAEKWLGDAKDTENYLRNLPRYAARYPRGLPPYVVGVPVIS